MAVIAEGQFSFGGTGDKTIAISNPSKLLPYVMLKSSDNSTWARWNYCAITSDPYNYVRVRNEQNTARTIYYTVYL